MAHVTSDTPAPAPLPPVTNVIAAAAAMDEPMMIA